MNNIWSKNKYIEYLIDLLLFLTGINFLHYGQLFLPIICLILFIENKFVFKVNRPLIFVILCLFAVSFYYFSYPLGFYSVMGFCLPMAYYIASNIKEPSFKKVKRVVFLLAFSMGFHLALNFIYNYSTRGLERILHSSSHRDIWLQDITSSTALAIDLNLLMGCLYYSIFYEKDKRIKVSVILLFAFDMIYCLIMGRRTPLLLLLIILFVSFVYDAFIGGSASNKMKKLFLSISLFLVLAVAVFLFVYLNNIGNCKEFLDSLYIIIKLKNGIIDYTRIEPLINGIKLMPKYLWGGQKISSELGIQVHELWIDIYDFAGIIPYLLMIVYSLFYLFVFVKALRSRNIGSKEKALLVGIFLCISIQMFLEPVMTGESIFLIVSIMVGAALERELLDE